MSVLIVTSLGDIVVDLHTDRCPLTTKNFLKLCKIKYFNGCLFHTVQKDFTAQTGDPTGKGTGGDSVYKFLYGDQARFFSDEIHPGLKHSKTGTVAMASAGENLNASQFYFTLRDDLDYLDGKHTVFGEVAEGLDTLMRINEAYVDEKGRPYKNIRIKHTYILDDPFDDTPQLVELIPERSPEGKPADEMEDVRLEDDWVPIDEQLGPAELEEALRVKEAESNAVFLETIGDIPDSEIKPPDNVLFVCKLNPVTQDEDLDTIFSRFGNVLSAEVIRDYKTGDSLCYAFIEFEMKESCEMAYFKMDNALIDDRRIHVDFSQSVAKLWSQYRRGKGGQTGRGNGCFKCGGLDHIAKDCTEGTRQQNPKYVLKDENAQRGGEGRQSYEMVFDGDTLATEDDTQKSKRNDRSSEDIRRELVRSDPRSERLRHDERSRVHREDRGQGNRERRRDGHHGVQALQERTMERHGDEEHRRTRDENHHKSRERDDRKRSMDHDTDHYKRDGRDDRSSKDCDGERHKKDEHDDKKRSIVCDSNTWRRDGRDDRSSKDHDGECHKKDEHDDKKRSIVRDSDTWRRDGRDDRSSKDRDGEHQKKDEHDDKKRSKVRDSDTWRRDGRDDRSSKGRDGERQKKDEYDDKKRSKVPDSDSWRRDEQDDRKRRIEHDGEPHRRDDRNDKRSLHRDGDARRRDGRDDRKRSMDHEKDIHREDFRDNRRRRDHDHDSHFDKKHRSERR